VSLQVFPEAEGASHGEFSRDGTKGTGAGVDPQVDHQAGVDLETQGSSSRAGTTTPNSTWIHPLPTNSSFLSDSCDCCNSEKILRGGGGNMSIFFLFL